MIIILYANEKNLRSYSYYFKIEHGTNVLICTKISCIIIILKQFIEI